jgi:hypothetical protein
LRRRRGAGLGDLQREHYRTRPHPAFFARCPKLER